MEQDYNQTCNQLSILNLQNITVAMPAHEQRCFRKIFHKVMNQFHRQLDLDVILRDRGLDKPRDTTDKLTVSTSASSLCSGSNLLRMSLILSLDTRGASGLLNATTGAIFGFTSFESFVADDFLLRDPDA